MAVILPGAGDYESALRMMGEANAIDAFAEGRERSVRMQGELQRQALQRQAAEQREDEINRKQALESAGFTEEMLASALSGGGGGATGGGGRRRASSAGPALDYEAASLQEALAADTAEAQAASTQRMRELDAAQMALAKQLPAQAALEGEVDAGAARQRLLSGPPSYAARADLAELEALDHQPPDPDKLRDRQLMHIAARLRGTGLNPEEVAQFAEERGLPSRELAAALGAAGAPEYVPSPRPADSLSERDILEAERTESRQQRGPSDISRAVDELRRRQLNLDARPRNISEPDWRVLKKQREEYSRLAGGKTYRGEDGVIRSTATGNPVANQRPSVMSVGNVEDMGDDTRLYRKDELNASREELIAAGAQAVTNPLGQEEYWLPEGTEFALAKAGPVDDTVEGTAEGGGFIQGRLASANKRLSEQTTKTNTLRSAVRRLKKKSGDQLVNPWERFGKPATFMPSIRATSFAVQRAKDGDPSLISQMIGRQLYPSELRDLESLTSNYQDFAGGVRAKATDITKSRKTAAQEAADKEAMGISTKYASLATGLVAGSKMGGMSQEDMDTFSDTIGAIATKDPKAAMEIAKLYTQMNNKERELSIKASKNRGTGPGGLGDKTVRTEHRNWTKILASVEDDIRAAYTKQNEKLFGQLVQDKKGVYRLKKGAPDNMKKAYQDAQAGIKALLQQHARARTMVSQYDGLMGLTAPVAKGSDVKKDEAGTPAQFSKAVGLLRSSVGGDGETLFDTIATASEEDLAAHKASLLTQTRRGDGGLVFGGNEAFVDELIKRTRSQGAARGGEPEVPEVPQDPPNELDQRIRELRGEEIGLGAFSQEGRLGQAFDAIFTDKHRPLALLERDLEDLLRERKTPQLRDSSGLDKRIENKIAEIEAWHASREGRELKDLYRAQRLQRTQ